MGSNTDLLFIINAVKLKWTYAKMDETRKVLNNVNTGVNILPFLLFRLLINFSFNLVNIILRGLFSQSPFFLFSTDAQELKEVFREVNNKSLSRWDDRFSSSYLVMLWMYWKNLLICHSRTGHFRPISLVPVLSIDFFTAYAFEDHWEGMKRRMII